MSTPDPVPDRPSALDAIGVELRRVATADARRPRRARWAARARRPLIILVALAAPTAAVAAVVQQTIPGPRTADLPRESQIVPGTLVISALRVDDPSGGLPWTVRTGRSRGGQRCLTVGQVDVRRRFGIVGLDGRFRTLADGAVDACADATGPGPWIVGARTLTGSRTRPTVTVVSGLMSAPVRNARVVTSDGAAVPAASDDRSGALLAVLRGTAARLRPIVRGRYASGRRLDVALGRPSLTLASGPLGPDWRIEATAPGPTRSVPCVQLSQVPTIGGEPAVAPGVCGDPSSTSPAAFAVRRLVPGSRTPDALAGRPTVWPRTAPAVTAVWGVAGDDVRTVTVTGGPDGSVTIVPARTAALVPHGLVFRTVPAARRPASPRAFAAVFSGTVDPARLRVTVVRRDGRATTHRGSHGTVDATGDRIALGPQPALAAGASQTGDARVDPQPARRAPAPSRPSPRASATTPSRRPSEPGTAAVPDPPRRTGTGDPTRTIDANDRPRWTVTDARVRTIDAADPQRGDGWRLRVRRAVDRHGDAGVCLLLLRIGDDRRPRLAHGDDRPARPAADDELGECRSRRAVGPFGTVLSRTPLRGAGGDRPRAGATAFFGWVAPGAAGLRLHGPGAPADPLPAGPDGAFLLVRPVAELHRPALGWQSVRADGTPTTAGGAALGGGQRPDPSARLASRVPDPDGGAPWGVFAGERGEQCAAIGQVVGDAVGTVDVVHGLFTETSRRRCGGPRDLRRIARDVVAVRAIRLPWTADASNAAATARRTAPGRTAVVLYADPSVERITLRTSRDVRTLVPRGPGRTALVVYDGVLQGDLDVRAERTGGRVWTTVRSLGG